MGPQSTPAPRAALGVVSGLICRLSQLESRHTPWPCGLAACMWHRCDGTSRRGSCSDPGSRIRRYSPGFQGEPSFTLGHPALLSLHGQEEERGAGSGGRARHSLQHHGQVRDIGHNTGSTMDACRLAFSSFYLTAGSRAACCLNIL